jgi:hypothetical protein
MSNQKNIQNELKALESGLPFNNNQPFSVPEGYFEGLAAEVLAKVKGSEVSAEAELGELSPLLAGIPKITPYSVPFSYFQENVENGPGLVQAKESAVLAYIGKELLYSVPFGYFDALPDQILSKVAIPKTRVIPLFARTWMRVASAAVVAGALFFAGLQLFNKSEIADPIAQPIDATQKQLAQNTQPIIKDIHQASTEELEEFIKTVQITAAKAPEEKNAKQEVEALLKDVTTTEMESFLSAIPASDDDLLVTD